MSDHDLKQHHPGGGGVPLIPTPQEQQRAEEQRSRAAEAEAARAHREADEAYKDRQLTLTEAANRLSARNLLFTSILAVFTIIGTAAAWYQGYIATKNARSAEVAAHAAKSAADTAESTLKELKTGQGAQDTHTLAQQAVTQAQQTSKLAGATAALAQTSKDALVSVQRAFVFATGFDGIRVGGPDNPSKIAYLEFSVTWENNGTTPTRNMTVYSSWLTPMQEVPSNYPYPDLGSGVPGHLALGPKMVAHTTPILVPADTIARIVNHQQHLYMWGWSRYRDIFPRSKSHITRYCTEITGFDGNPLSANPSDLVRPILSNCGTNCYDEECKTQ